MQRSLPRLMALCLLGLTAAAPAAVFQYRIAAEGDKAIFLWIPPETTQVRGVVASGMTLMEREMSRDPIIRQACAKKGLAILFSSKGIGGIDLQTTLKQFAEISGYRELPYAPLMFVGHSAGGPPSGKLAAEHADRCFGLVQYRGGGPGNVNLPPTVPALMMVGQFDEFGGTMRKEDGREQWQNGADHLARYRAETPGSLSAIVVEPGRGHFAWSEKNARFLATWITKAAEARIPENWPIQTDKPIQTRKVDPASGWLVDLDAIADASKAQMAPYNEYKGDKDRAVWLFDKETAEAWVEYHAGGFGKKDQFIKWNDRYWVDAGTRYFFLGMDWVGPDTFEVHPVYADKVLSQQKGNGPKWPKAGQPVGHADAPIRVKHVSGPVRPVGDHRFQMHYDNLNPPVGPQRVTFMAFSEGDDEYRYTEQVGMMPRGFKGLRKGKAQTISFPEIPNLPADAKPYDLKAKSDADLPVQYYVAYGPARVEDGKLVINQIPQRAKFPIEVEVVAWQFGSGVEPLVKTAEPVSRTFQITKP